MSEGVLPPTHFSRSNKSFYIDAAVCIASAALNCRTLIAAAAEAITDTQFTL